MNPLTRSLIVVPLLAFVATLHAAEERTLDRWDLSRIYSDRAAWEAAFGQVEQRVELARACQGRLGDGAAKLKYCLDTVHDLRKELDRVTSYARMTYDENTRVAESQELSDRADLLGNRLSQALSFVRPEILALGAQRVDTFLAQEPGLAVYRHILDDILRRGAHTRSADEEEIIATAGLVADAPYSVYNILANADVPWPTVTLSDGSEVRLDQAAYTKHRSAVNRDDRRKVFEAFWSTWKDYTRTFGTTLFSQMKRDAFYAKVRRYDSALESALDDSRVPVAVYHTLIRETNASLGTLHRYFRLRARMLGVDQLRYHDIYPPLVETDKVYPIDEAKRMVLESARPLGEEYVSVVARGFDQRWMDVYPRPGKQSGAYSNGAVYDVHPFVLMNYNDDYESLSTLAHEWGHAMHSYLANAAQPYPTADYSIFLAEVASTLNEALLLEKMLKEARDDEARLFYLGSALEQLRGTYFRQAMFAEFELRIHEIVERGEALSGERLTQIYGDILRRYHGHDQGVVVIDDAYAVEWAYIPHFYYNFYVYQYATSVAASSLIADRILQGEPGAAQTYLGLLEAGGSDYPYELLKRAGVDLATADPYRSMAARMERIMDEIEAILDRREKGRV
jgi:oligoendopeptidase F